MIKTIALLTFGLLVGGSPVMMAEEPSTPETTEVAPSTTEEVPPTSETEPEVVVPSTEPSVETPVETPTEEEFDIGAWFERNLPPVVISNIVQGVVLLGGIFKVLASAKELAKKNHTTMDEVVATLKTVLKDGITDEVQKGMNDMINPLRDSLMEIKPYFETFAKILALSQDNSPESKLAILQLIQDMGKTDTQALVEETKKAVEDTEAKKNEDQTAKIETLDSIIEEPKQEPTILPVE